jgi:nucleotide-binding universal stress UspA family protein
MDQTAFQRILLAYDGSEGAKKARDMAATLARMGGGAVIVVTAFHAMPRVSTPDAGDVAEIHEARGLADWVVDSLAKQDISGEPDVLEGPAADAILNAADVHQADIIVIGSRGMGQLAGLLMGSVSDHVVHYAKVPVLVVR